MADSYSKTFHVNVSSDAGGKFLARAAMQDDSTDPREGPSYTPVVVCLAESAKSALLMALNELTDHVGRTMA